MYIVESSIIFMNKSHEQVAEPVWNKQLMKFVHLTLCKESGVEI